MLISVSATPPPLLRGKGGAGGFVIYSRLVITKQSHFVLSNVAFNAISFYLNSPKMQYYFIKLISSSPN